MKRIQLIVSIFAGLILLALLMWHDYKSPHRVAERITGLTLPEETEVVRYMDDYSVVLSSGIVCGELSVSTSAMNQLMKQAEEEGYSSNISTNQDNLLGVLKQSPCCQDSSIKFEKTPGFHKTLKHETKEWAYALLDAKNAKVYFFHSIAP